MVKVKTYDEERKGKEGEGIWQLHYGRQIRRRSFDRKNEKPSKAQIQRRVQFKQGLKFASSLSQKARFFLEDYYSRKGLRLSWQQLACKLALSTFKISYQIIDKSNNTTKITIENEGLKEIRIYDKNGNLLKEATGLTDLENEKLTTSYELTISNIQGLVQVEAINVSGTSEEYSFTLPTLWEKPPWKYRRKITITNSSTNNLTDYQVLITIDTASLISAGKMKSDGSDIRFTKDDKVTEIPYWIESGINTNSTKIWVKVPSIPANSTAVIYIYYGNQTATKVSNGNQVFLFFDDFEGDLSKWTVTGTCTTSSDYAYEGSKSLKCNAGYNFIRKTGFSPTTNISVHVKYYDRMTANKEEHIISADDGTTFGIVGIDEDINSTNYIYRIGSTYYNSGIARRVGWHEFRITRDGSKREFWIDGTKMTTSDTVVINRITVGSIWSANAEIAYFDAFYVRKYYTPEPSAIVDTIEETY